MRGVLDVMGLYARSGDLYGLIITILNTLPLPELVMIILVLSMVAFYATSFDSITLVASAYSYREIADDEEASPGMKLFWSILLIMLPIALIFSESGMSNLQTVSIIAAFPIAVVIILIIASFFKEGKKYIKDESEL